MTKEEYKREIARMFDSIRDDKYKGCYDYDIATCECSGVRSCEECALYGIDCGSSTNAFEMIEAVEKWAKEHPQKHKISQLEYDILKFNYYNNATSRFFCDDKFLMSLLKEGYFKGADERDVVNCYFLDCEVVD